MAAPADVVNFAGARRANECGEGFDQIEAVNVVAHLFSFVTENAIRPAAHGADHQVGEKSVQLGAGVGRAGQATAAKTNRRHSEIAAVFLHQNVRRDFRRAEERMLRVIDAHGFGNSRLVFVARLDFPALVQFAQRQPIRRVAIDFVRRRKNERRFRANFARRFEQIQRAVGVDREIRLRIARRPIVRRLRRGVHDRARFCRRCCLNKSRDRLRVANVDVVMLVFAERS